MSQVHRICQQMQQAFNGEAWHGPSVLEILNGVNAGIAVDKPIPGGHSVWEIVLHLIGTQDLLLNRLQGIGKELAPDQDWPPVPEPTEAAWCETVERLEQQDKALREAVARFPDERLEEALVSGGSSAYNNFHGYVQHNLYHAAQIGLIKKIVVGT